MTKVLFIDLLKDIEQNKVNTKNLQIKYKDNIFRYDKEANSFSCISDDYIGFISEICTDMELITMEVEILDSDNNEIENNYYNKAKQEVINEISQTYMDLEMSIDNCQGCMNGLNEAFEKLKIYKDICNYLGYNIDEHMQEITNKWFEEAKNRREQEEKNEKLKDKILEKPQISLMDVASLETAKELDRHLLTSVLIDIILKIHEISDIIRNKE